VAGVLTVHLLAMNVACGGPLLCIWLSSGERNSKHSKANVGHSLAWLSICAYLIGLLTGGGLLLLPLADELRGAMGRFPARAYWFAGAELLFSALCLWVYARLWGRRHRWRWVHALVALVAVTNLLYHFPPLMVVLGKLARDPAWTVEAVIDRPLFLKLMVRPEVLSLSLHFGLASFAVAAMAVLAVIARKEFTDSQQKSCRGAARIALLSTLLQLPVGIWVLTEISESARGTLLGGNVLASALFLGSLLTTVYLLQGLTRIALGDFVIRDCQRVFWLSVFVVLLMTATLRLSRQKEQGVPVAVKETSLGEETPRLVESKNAREF
jgi:hypothetical protein